MKCNKTLDKELENLQSDMKEEPKQQSTVAGEGKRTNRESHQMVSGGTILRG